MNELEEITKRMDERKSLFGNKIEPYYDQSIMLMEGIDYLIKENPTSKLREYSSLLSEHFRLVLEDKIKKDMEILYNLPTPPNQKSFQKKDFLERFEKEVKPTLDEILGESYSLPPVDMDLTKENKTKLILSVITAPILVPMLVYCGYYMGMLGGVLSGSLVGALYGLWGGRIMKNCRAFYNRKEKRINLCLPYANYESLSTTLVHEHTHHYQNLENFSLDALLREGHARTIECYTAKALANKTGNLEWLRNPLINELDDLKSVYFALFNQDPFSKKFYEKIINRIDVKFMQYAYPLKKNSHAMGTATFILAEYYFGNRLYEELKKKNYQWLLPY